MVITRRDIAILVTFCGLLVVAVVLFVRHQGGPPPSASDRPTATARKTGNGGSRSRTTPATSVEPEPADTGEGDVLTPAAVPGTIPAPYQVILARALFNPLFKRAKANQAVAKGNLPPVPNPSKSGKQQKAGDAKGKNTSAPNTAGGTPGSVPTKPPAPPVSVTGLLRYGNGYRVVLEHNEFKLTRILRVGDEAWGYRVAEVDGDAQTVTLEVPGGSGQQPLMLKLGEGKKVETNQPATPQPAATAPQPAAQPETPTRSGFDPSRLSPEQRARFEEWRQRRGMRRRDGGGGDGGGGRNGGRGGRGGEG